MAPVDDVEKDKIEAKVTDGVLHITLFPPWLVSLWKRVNVDKALWFIYHFTLASICFLKWVGNYSDTIM